MTVSASKVDYSIGNGWGRKHRVSCSESPFPLASLDVDSVERAKIAPTSDVYRPIGNRWGRENGLITSSGKMPAFSAKLFDTLGVIDPGPLQVCPKHWSAGLDFWCRRGRGGR